MIREIDLRGSGVRRAGDRFPRKAEIGRATALCALVCGLVATPSTGAADDKAETGDLEIVVTNLESDEGSLVVALLNSAAQYDAEDQMFRSDTEIEIHDGVASVTYEDLPFGSYAVKAFHDENSNGELDTNFVGFPKEGFGFSNNAMGNFGPPSFEEARFELATEKLRVEITSN